MQVLWEQYRFHDARDLREEGEIFQRNFPDVEFSEVTAVFHKFLDGDGTSEVHESFREGSRFRGVADAPFHLKGLRERFFWRVSEFFLEVPPCVRKGMSEGEGDCKGGALGAETFFMVGGEKAVLIEDRETFLGFQAVRASASEHLEWLTLSIFRGEGMRFDFVSDEGGNVVGGETGAVADVDDFSSDGAVGDHVLPSSDGPLMEAAGGQGFAEAQLRHLCREEKMRFGWEIACGASVHGCFGSALELLCRLSKEFH